MSVSTIKGLAWLTSAVLTAGLGYRVYEFKQDEKRLAEEPLFDTAEATRILKQVHATEGPPSTTVSGDLVQKTWYELNWTGEPPKKIEKVIVVEDAERPKELVETLLHVVFIQEDSDAPKNSAAFVRYKGPAGVTGPAKDFGQRLLVGDTLPERNSHIKVERISAVEGVTFSFTDDPEREHETVISAAFQGSIPIHKIGEDGEIIAPKQHPIPKVEGAAVYKPEKTIPIGKNHYQIGTEDAQVFGDDFAGIIAREVRHARHRDPQTGKFDGIELKSVQTGGTASRHGAQTGDIIKSINGHAVTSSSEAITFVKNNQDQYSTWTVVIENRGRERTVTYESPPE